MRIRVIGVQDVDKLTRCEVNALGHAIENSRIGRTLVAETATIEHREGAIARAGVDHDMLERGVILSGDRLAACVDRRRSVIGRRDYADHRRHGCISTPLLNYRPNDARALTMQLTACPGSRYRALYLRVFDGRNDED